MRIEETCACGAQFNMTAGDTYWTAARDSAAEWRREHRHIERPLVMWGGDQA